MARKLDGSIHDAIDAINNESVVRLAKQDEKIVQNITRQDLLENKYDEQIKNIAASEPQNAEIVDARLGFDTLGSVIKQKVYHFENVEKMKKCLTLLPGDVCETLGYYEANDGGGAKYVVRLKVDEDVDDGGSIHFVGTDLVAELIINDSAINVKQMGAYGDNIHDDLIAIQNSINKFSCVYFPNGFYYISDGLVANKDIILKGCSKLNFPSSGSFIRMTKASTTLFTGNNGATHVELDCIGFYSTSSKITADSNLSNRTTEPYNPYHYTETAENCNGILVTKKLKITNCYFTGFSGYGINANANSIITDVWVSNCNVGINVNGFDPVITRPYITLCKTGIKLLQSSATSIFLYDIWIDQIVEHAINCASITGIITGIIDHIGYCGIYATGNAKINLDMRIGRCGMYYAGTPKENLTNEQLEFCSGLYLTNIFNSQIKYTFEHRDIGSSSGETDYMLPKCILTTKQFIDSIFQFIEDDTKYIGCKVINTTNSNGTIITQNGIKKWNPTSKNFVDIYNLNT